MEKLFEYRWKILFLLFYNIVLVFLFYYSDKIWYSVDNDVDISRTGLIIL